MTTWKADHHDYKRPVDRESMTDAEKQGACAECGKSSAHWLHRSRAPLAEEWADRARGNLTKHYGNLTSVVAWLEEMTHTRDSMARTTQGTQKSRAYEQGLADAFRMAAEAILEIDNSDVDLADIPIYGSNYPHYLTEEYEQEQAHGSH